METFCGHPVIRQSPARTPTKRRRTLDAAFHEVFTNVPSTVTRAKVSGKRKHKMMVAVALNKARARGAKIPRR